MACSVKFNSINMMTVLLLRTKHWVRLLEGSKEEKNLVIVLEELMIFFQI